MEKVKILLEKDLRTRVDSEVSLVTDAPKAVSGLGEFFSPTDLLVISVASCMLTMMGYKAKELKVDLVGSYLQVTKEMQVAPIRRLKSINVEFFCPRAFSTIITEQLIQAAERCPVIHSLHPEIQKKVIYHWEDTSEVQSGNCI
ncbi:OsmC family protein [Candidatus Rhabdochlamydia sp. T3358]|jgi:putative redox protein|uniref:OsmC family protein n=1 Tax=Candidatus Rhabdochlamydia sp. T3358 TaxID=2099795 RepID=UPI0010AEF30E|nr:OsmC family protein [Candidatus Rhabdochlamydia sp. T3358]VHO02842.1 OsmC-like protein [Candidatus Rhabdochlamydia sp. T3358]